MKQALIATYLVQAYVTLTSVVLMPVYLAYLGAEGFGLVGFATVLQTWMQLLDFGFSPALSREMSLYRAGGRDAGLAMQRMRSVELLFALIAFAAVVAFVAARDWVAVNWFSYDGLSASEISWCFVAMAVGAVLRWLAGLYRSALTGLERQSWLNTIALLSATVRSVGVIPVLAYVSASPRSFFGYQVFVAAAELVALAGLFYRAMPRVPGAIRPTETAYRALVPTAGAVAFLALVSLLLTQLDKVILSRLLTLAEYGHFTLASALAGGVLIMTGPMSQILQPRMTVLLASGKSDELTDLYEKATVFAAIGFFSLGGGIAVFSSELLWAWTGSRAVSDEVSQVLAAYAIANAFVGVLTLPYLLQFSHGYLRMHLVGNIILGLVVIPSLVVAAMKFGALGAALVYLVANIIFLFFWSPLVHRRFLPLLAWRWPFRQVVPSATVSILLLLAMKSVVPAGEGRIAAGITAVASMCITALVGVALRVWVPGGRNLPGRP